MLDISQCRQRGSHLHSKHYIVLNARLHTSNSRIHYCNPPPTTTTTTTANLKLPSEPLAFLCYALPRLHSFQIFASVFVSVCFVVSSSRCHCNKRVWTLRGLKLNNLCTTTLNAQTGCSQNIQKPQTPKKRREAQLDGTMDQIRCEAAHSRLQKEGPPRPAV